MEQHEATEGWRLCYATPRSRSSKEPPAGLLAEFLDLDAREDALSIRRGSRFFLGRVACPTSMYWSSSVRDRFGFWRRTPKTPTRWICASTCPSFPVRAWIGVRRRNRTWRTSSIGGGAMDVIPGGSPCQSFPGTRCDRKVLRVAAAAGAVSGSPVAMREREDAPGEITSTPKLRPKAVRSIWLKWLTPRAYRRWRDVGLAGYLADGNRDAKWRGRTDGRNLAMSETLWSSGLRLREGGTLLRGELPTFEAENRYARGRVGKAVAKGRGRDYWVHGRALKLIDNYVISERDAAVRRGRREGRYDAIADLKIVQKVDRSRRVHYLSREGERKVTPLDELTWKDRMTFFTKSDDGLDPWMVWLTDGGMPLPYRTWEKVFTDASDRCEALGVDIHCHPHMLRHSFALRMLMTLIYAHDRRMGITPEERREFRMVFGDPGCWFRPFRPREP